MYMYLPPAVLFREIDIAVGGFSSEVKEPVLYKLGVIMIKTIQFDQK